MPQYPVPRWLPGPSTSHYRYADALGENSPTIGHGDPAIVGESYPGQYLSATERKAGYFMTYRASGQLDIWQPIPAGQWLSLPSGSLYRVEAHKPTLAPDFAIWQYPEAVQGALRLPGTQTRIKVDWQTIRYEFEPGAALSLEQYFTREGIAYDYRETPPLVRPEEVPDDAYFLTQIPATSENYLPQYKLRDGRPVPLWLGAISSILRPGVADRLVPQLRAEWIAQRKVERYQHLLSDIRRLKRGDGGSTGTTKMLGFGYVEATPDTQCVLLAPPGVTVPAGTICFAADVRDIIGVARCVRTIPAR